MVAKPGWHLDGRTRGLWPVVVNMSAHAALSKIRLEKRPIWLFSDSNHVTSTVTFYHADIPWPLLMARSAVLTRTHALIFFSTHSQSSGQPGNHADTFPPSSSITCNSCKERQFWHLYCFVRSCRFKSHGYTQCDPKPAQKSAWKWQIPPFVTFCTKNYKVHWLVQASFAELSKEDTCQK